MGSTRRYLLMTVAAVVLAGCAGGPEGSPPSLTYDYVEGRQIEPPGPETPHVPMPIGGVPTANDPPPPPEKRYKSDSAKLADNVRKSRRSALDCTFEGAIMTCPYQNGARYQIKMDGPSADGATDSDVTQFWLEPGEGNPEVIFGNPQWFNAEVTGGGVSTESMRAKRDRANKRQGSGARLILAVKAYKAGERTSMSVATGNRVYLYDLVVNPCKQAEGAEPRKCNAPFAPVVQHTYDTDQPKLKTASATASRRKAPQVSDTRYDYLGAAEFLPGEWSAYNDSVNTYILPPARLASRPVPVFPKGTSPDFWVDPSSGHYVIRGLPAEVVFKRGNLAMSVRRER